MDLARTPNLLVLPLGTVVVNARAAAANMAAKTKRVDRIYDGTKHSLSLLGSNGQGIW